MRVVGQRMVPGVGLGLAQGLALSWVCAVVEGHDVCKGWFRVTGLGFGDPRH